MSVLGIGAADIGRVGDLRAVEGIGCVGGEPGERAADPLAGFVHAVLEILLPLARGPEFMPQPVVFVGQAASLRDEALELLLEPVEFRIHGSMVGSTAGGVKPAAWRAACDSIAA